MTTLTSIKNEIEELKAAWKQAQDERQPQEIPAAMRNFRFKHTDHDIRHGGPSRPAGHAKIMKEKARAQRSITGNSSKPYVNSDTAPPTIRSTLALPVEYYGAAEGENH